MAKTGDVNDTGGSVNHSGLIGLRYAFDQAAPAPPRAPVEAAPVLAPSRSYLVFFDWDNAALTTRGADRAGGAGAAEPAGGDHHPAEVAD